MATIDIEFTFRGMGVPTVCMTGHDACCVTSTPVPNGSKKKQNALMFAYKEGEHWGTKWHDPQVGQYRFTLIHAKLHCSQIITIDEQVLNEGVIRVQFDRRDCRRKLIPVWLRRIWKRWCKAVKKHTHRPKRLVAKYRRRFRRGPVGTWLESHDRLTIYGASFEFRKDLTGSVHTWGYEEDGSETEWDFRWKLVSDFVIDVQPIDGRSDSDDWGVIEYDFKATLDAYGSHSIEMYSTKSPCGVDDEPRFWWASPVVLVE